MGLRRTTCGPRSACRSSARGRSTATSMPVSTSVSGDGRTPGLLRMLLQWAPAELTRSGCPPRAPQDVQPHDASGEDPGGQPLDEGSSAPGDDAARPPRHPGRGTGQDPEPSTCRGEGAGLVEATRRVTWQASVSEFFSSSILSRPCRPPQTPRSSTLPPAAEGPHPALSPVIVEQGSSLTLPLFFLASAGCLSLAGMALVYSKRRALPAKPQGHAANGEGRGKGRMCRVCMGHPRAQGCRRVYCVPAS